MTKIRVAMIACSFLATQNPRRRSFAISIYVCRTASSSRRAARASPGTAATASTRRSAPHTMRSLARSYSRSLTQRDGCAVCARASFLCVASVLTRCWKIPLRAFLRFAVLRKNQSRRDARHQQDVNGTHLALESEISATSRVRCYDDMPRVRFLLFDLPVVLS